MKSAPNSKSNLDRALQRFAGDFARANDLRGQMANAIVAQMIGEGVVKGGQGGDVGAGIRRSEARP